MHNENSDNLDSLRGGIVSARGTGDGLIIRLDGRVENASLKGALEEFMNSRKSFLSGNEVYFEWVGVEPSKLFVDELSDLLKKDFKIEVKSSRLRDKIFKVEEDSNKMSDELLLDDKDFALSDSPNTGLFGGVGAVESAKAKSETSSVSGVRANELWDEPDARLYFGTMRSGQKIESEHSVVIVGDINPGAEVVAGGDIIVIGSMRGVAHAGAYVESGGGRVIIALNLQPTQLRIGTVISRGPAAASKVPEIARVEGELIVVENYSTKILNILARH